MTGAGAMDAILLSERDNVATVLHAVAAAEIVRIGGSAGNKDLLAAGAVPMCHKIALVAIAAGAPIIKYGEVIGVATQPIAVGTHVHIHNLSSRRGRAARS